MRKDKTVTIGEDTYVLKQLPTSKMLAVTARVANIAATLVPAGELQDAATSKSKLFQMFAEACRNPKLAEHLDFFCAAFQADRATVVLLGGKEQDLARVFEEHFGGRPKELLQWIWESIAHNMGDGFLELLQKSGGTSEKV